MDVQVSIRPDFDLNSRGEKEQKGKTGKGVKRARFHTIRRYQNIIIKEKKKKQKINRKKA